MLAVHHRAAVSLRLYAVHAWVVPVDEGAVHLQLMRGRFVAQTLARSAERSQLFACLIVLFHGAFSAHRKIHRCERNDHLYRLRTGPTPDTHASVQVAWEALRVCSSVFVFRLIRLVFRPGDRSQQQWWYLLWGVRRRHFHGDRRTSSLSELSEWPIPEPYEHDRMPAVQPRHVRHSARVRAMPALSGRKGDPAAGCDQMSGMPSWKLGAQQWHAGLPPVRSRGQFHTTSLALGTGRVRSVVS
jgi:hypothetical protein